MKIAVITTHAGTPGTLASSAFARAMMDGFSHAGVRARIVGLARHQMSWRPESMEPYETSTPWIRFRSSRLRDIRAAAGLGVFDSSVCADAGAPATAGSWGLEFLLQRDLEEFAGDDCDLAIMVYPRVYAILRMLTRIASRKGWKLIVISTEALNDVQIDPRTRDSYVRCAAGCADGIWVLSDYLARYWQEQGALAERIHTSPPAVREEAFVSDAVPERHLAVYAGNLEHREIEYLLDISATVRRSLPHYRLKMYGDTSDARRRVLADAIESRGLAGVVSIEQPVPPSQVQSVLGAADVLVLPRSHGEFSQAGFPNKLGEYLATGRPVVVTRVGDIPKYLTDKETAFLVEPDDCDAFAHAVIDAMSDRGPAERIGAAGRLLAQQRLASSVVMGDLVTFVEALPVRGQAIRGTGGGWSRGLRVTTAVVTTPAVNAYLASIALARRLGLNKSGQYGLVVTKILIVRILRFLHLWPKAPGDRPDVLEVR